jgi:hypothetical protein
MNNVILLLEYLSYYLRNGKFKAHRLDESRTHALAGG